MKNRRFDRRTFLKSAVANSAAAVSVKLSQSGEAQQKPGAPAAVPTASSGYGTANRMPLSGLPDARERADVIA